MDLLRALRGLYRDRTAAHSNRVSSIELFFDLIFVFAVTQLSHLLLSHFDLAGALHATVLLLAVWWVWVYTSWTTNWLNPEKGAVRVVMFVLTALGLVMGTAIPDAFNGSGLLFAGAYVAMQIGRTTFMTLCSYSHSDTHFLNFRRVLLWMAVSGAFWLCGAFMPEYRLWLWIGALFLEYVAPSVMFYVPGLGPSQLADWDVDGEHMAERCGLFIMIALGESIVVTGESFGHSQLDRTAITAFATDFLGCAAMWWLYFGLTAHKGTRAITHDALPGRIARTAYTYVHILLVAGIIVSAVGAEQVLSEALEPARFDLALTILGGPALYLLGNAVFVYVVNGHLAPLHGLGIVVLLAGIGALAVWPDSGVAVLGIGIAATVVLGSVSLFEAVLYRWRQGRLRTRPV